MFKNTGGKIKGVAVVFTSFGMVVSVVCGLCIMLSDSDHTAKYPIGVLIITLGCLVSWLSSLILYGFGELVERAVSIDEKLGNKNTSSNETIIKVKNTETATKPATSNTTEYSCKGIEVVGETLRGMCRICKNLDAGVKKCYIETDIGTRETFICENCIEKFKNNASE